MPNPRTRVVRRLGGGTTLHKIPFLKGAVASAPTYQPTCKPVLPAHRPMRPCCEELVGSALRAGCKT